MENKRILMVASEAVPFVKTGGLADVMGVLPQKLNELGNDCRVILPLYKEVKEKYIDDLQFMRWTTIDMGWRNSYSGLFKMHLNGVHYYFIDNEYYFNQDFIYSDADFDIERFTFFQRAVLDVMGYPMDFYPDFLHCHDWQTGLLPALLKAHYQSNGLLSNIKTAYTIHNLKYQGIHSYEKVADLSELPEEYMSEWGVLHNGDANFMKAGIVYADMVSTVSPAYAEEIKTPFYGEGLDGILRGFGHKVRGVLNGIDMDSYNPETDTDIVRNYNIDNVYDEKVKNKLALQEELGLEVNPDIPMITMITRLVDQKGLDLLIRVIDEIMEEELQFVLLGTGDPHYEYEMYLAEQRNYEKLRSCIMYDAKLSRRMYAGGDIFLMPSIYEPCGLSQMISMCYGNVPLVRDTGGLHNTVFNYNTETGEGNGFSFPNINAHDMLYLIKDAINLYTNEHEDWKKLMHTGMTSDFSWDKSAKEYDGLYDEILSWDH